MTVKSWFPKKCVPLDHVSERSLELPSKTSGGVPPPLVLSGDSGTLSAVPGQELVLIQSAIYSKRIKRQFLLLKRHCSRAGSAHTRFVLKQRTRVRKG